MDDGDEADVDGEGELDLPTSEREKTLSERVQYWNPVSKNDTFWDVAFD